MIRYVAMTGCAGMLSMLVFAAGCGVKSAPVPPELARPERIQDLQASSDPNGIKLGWARPMHYTGGHTMRDLSGFVILRGIDNSRLEPLVELPVTDRERFAVERDFSYIDPETEIGQKYRYEIVSKTADGYTSEPSNEVTITRAKHTPPPNPENFHLPMPTSAATPG